MIRSLIFLPGNTPNMLVNGDTLGADALILDLEDAVAPAQKDSARILVRNYLRAQPQRHTTIVVRINATDTAYWQKDLAAVLPEKPDIIMPTKVSGGAMIREISAYMETLEKAQGFPVNTIKLMPLLETALGVEKAFEIATSSERVMGFALGAEDLTADLQCRRTKEGKEILYARQRLICAARAAGIDVFDTPFTDVEDLEGLQTDATFARSLGFTGKLVISPRHVDTVNTVFSPTQEEIQYARDVLACIARAKEEGKGVVSLHGKMIDAPIVARAQQVCEAAAEIYGGSYDG